MEDNAHLAFDTIIGNKVLGIPTKWINPMEWAMIDRLAELPEGSYRNSPRATYLRMFEKVGVCQVDQWIPENPLSMGSQGYEEDTTRSATTGAEQIIRDGIVIDSPEAVVEHLETREFPHLEKAAQNFDEDERVRMILQGERSIQEYIGPDILKTGYGFISFPCFAYGGYGYVHYFMAFALYPEVIERHFSLQSDLAAKNNGAAARAYREGNLPPLYRLDHDMADSRGTLVNVEWLDRLWFPHFVRSLQPMLETDVKLIWHCDGNLSQMVPRLIDAGLHGFQGFQYEDGMDYEKICRMKTKAGDPLYIMAGVSVTRTLPYGKPEDVKRELAWLVENGPETGLVLGASSSIAPGVPWNNLKALVEGFQYYRKNGRRK